MIHHLRYNFNVKNFDILQFQNNHLIKISRQILTLPSFFKLVTKGFIYGLFDLQIIPKFSRLFISEVTSSLGLIGMG